MGYRPLTIVSLALDYRLSGLDPRFYHLTNILLHASNVMLIVALGRRLLRDDAVVITAAALFAVHALHTEAVAPVFGRADLLATCFVLLAWYLALARQPATVARSLAIAAAFLAGVLAKESAIAFAPLILCCDVLLRSDPGRSLKSRIRDTLLGGIRVYGMLALAVLVYSVWRYSVTGGIAYAENTIRYIENPLIEAGVVTRVATALWVLIEYLALFAWPVALSADYSFDQIPLVDAVSDTRLLGIAVALVAVIAIARRRSSRHVGIWLLLFALLIAPVSNVFFTVGTIMAERLMYMPSVPLCFLVGAVVARWARAEPAWRARTAVSVFAAMLVGNVALTVRHNDRWQSEERLFAATVGSAPRSAKAHFNYATTLLEKGDTPRAEEGLRTALAIAPNYPEAHNRLGTILLARGNLADAEREFRAALRGAPEFAPALANLGIVLRRLGRNAESEVLLTQAVDRDSGLATALVDLGLLAENRGDPSAAIAFYRRAYAIDEGLDFVRARAEALATNAASK